MARLPRLTLADQPHHVIQRGNNRQPIFVDAADREMLLSRSGEQAQRFGVALHAYVLMDNHFHLLATPSAADGLPQWMQAVGRGYVRYFNDRHGRSGTLWEGRYKSSLIQTERYLLACMAYIDLNPVRDGHGGRGRRLPLVQPCPLRGPAARPAADAASALLGARQHAVRPRGRICRNGARRRQPADQALITDATLHGWAAGDPEFAESLQKATGRADRQGTARAAVRWRPRPASRNARRLALAKHAAIKFDVSPI